MCKVVDSSNAGKREDEDADDFFIPSRPTNVHATESLSEKMAEDASSQTAIQICMLFLSLAPVLQSPSGESTRDRELIDLVLDCSEHQFLLVGPYFLDNVRRRTLDLNAATLGKFLLKFEPMLLQYNF